MRKNELKNLGPVMLTHITQLDAAVNIMVEGFYPRDRGLMLERGANFHVTGNINEANQVRTGCTLNFEWRGPVVDSDELMGKANVLYNCGPWRKFIRNCNNNDLIFVGYEIEEEIYVRYNISLKERIRFFSRKRACIAYFNKHISKRILVNSGA